MSNETVITNPETVRVQWGIRTIRDGKAVYTPCTSHDEAYDIINEIDANEPSQEPRLVKRTVVISEWEFNN